MSIGFNTPAASIPWAPNVVAPIAARVRRETGFSGAACWYISNPAEEADALIRDDRLDLVMLGRPLPTDPHWPYAAARARVVENGLGDAAAARRALARARPVAQASSCATRSGTGGWL